MKSLRLLALAVVLAAHAAPAQAACPPAKLVLSTIRGARSVQVLRLGPRSERDVDWQSDDPDVFLGYEVLDSNPLSAAEVAMLTKVLGSPASYDCKSELQGLTPTAAAVDIGFTIHSEVAVVRVVLRANESQVELELFNGAHTRSGLSAAGHKGVERLLDAYAVRTAGSRKAWALSSEEYFIEELPEVTYRTGPQYPTAARDGKVEGTVQVYLFVSTTGSVDSVRVTKSIPMLDAAAIAAVRQWRFKPAMIKGVPTACWVAVPVKFSLP